MYWILGLSAVALLGLVAVGAGAWFLLRKPPPPVIDEDDPYAAGPSPVIDASEPAKPAPPPPVLAPPVVAPPAAFTDPAEREPEPAPADNPAPAHRTVVPPAEAAELPAEPTWDDASPREDAETDGSEEGPAATVFEPLQKARVGGLDLVIRASAVRIGDAELLAFTTECFEGAGRPELVLYHELPTDDIDGIRAGLKILGGLALALHERAEPVEPGEILHFPGTSLAGREWAGFVAIQANEPVAVPLPDHLVLLGLAAEEIGDPAVLERLAAGGSLPFRRG